MTERNDRKKGIPEGTPELAPIGGEFGHCMYGIGACSMPRSCAAEKQCIVQYRIDTWIEDDDQNNKSKT